MTQKDYIAIASIVRECNREHPKSVALYHSMLVSKLAVYLEERYSGSYDFNSAKFRAACYGKGKGKKDE